MGITDDFFDNAERDDNIIDHMSRVTGVKYSDEQLAILRQKGGMCILASAGSGKTTVMNHLIAKRIQSGEIAEPSKLLCTTFSKGGADEMGQRLESLLKQLGVRSDVQVKTLHAVYLRLLRDLGYNFGIVENSTKMKYIRESCKENSLTLEDEDYQTLDGIFGYQVNNLLSDDALFKSYAYTLREQIPLEKYSAIRQTFSAKKQKDGCMDFDDMQLFVYTLLMSPQYGEAIKNYCHSLWEYIYVDEAQDVSKIQFEILKVLISDPNKFVFIGDDDQCIYQWRGADPSIILNVCGVYTDLTLMKLTTNYRCKGQIVDRADHGIKFNATRSNKTMHPYEEGGDIRVVDTSNGKDKDNLYEMSKYAYKYIKELIIDKGVPANEIAVLSRNNLHLSILNNMLFKDGIYCKCTNDMKFTKCSAYRLIEGIIEMGQNTRNGNTTAANLWKCCRYMKVSASREIGRLQNAYGAPLKDIIGLLITEYSYCQSAVDWTNPGMRVSKMDYAKYSYLMERMNTTAVNDLITIYKMLDSESPKEAVIGMLAMFTESKVGFFFKSDESSRFINGYIEYICHLINTLGIAGFNRYILATRQFEDGGMAVMSPMVTLSTMHGAKGKEWKYVLLFADDNISFPSFQNIQKNMEDGVPESDIRNMIDENRRLHYVAMTRAKDQLVIFANKKNLGIYTLESLGVLENDKDNDNRIIIMSQHGLYDELVKQAQEKIFSPESPYYMKIDISDLNTKVEHQYEDMKAAKQAVDEGKYVSEEDKVVIATEVKQPTSYFDMPTFQPMTLGDEDD